MPFKLSALSEKGPFYYPITEQLQRVKCQQLEIGLTDKFEQHSTLTGTLLSKIIPWETEETSMDGNCFFRCISKMISAPEAHHIKLRAEVCRYMVTDGKPIINRYLRTFSKDDTPVSYLNRSAMTESGTWATDVEIMAISCILDSDVYIATQQYDVNKIWTRTIWNRYSGRVDHQTRNPQEVTLYVSNVNHNNYEPVIRLMNSDYESFKIHYSNNLTADEGST